MDPRCVFSTNSKTKADLMLQRMREAGLPVSWAPGRAGSEAFPLGGPFEIWIEAEALLKDPEILKSLEDAKKPSVFTPEQEEEIANMPLVEEKSEVGYGLLLIVGIVVIVLLFALLKTFPNLLRLFQGS